MTAGPTRMVWSWISRDQAGRRNAKIESFNGRLREGCLNAHWFLSLDDAKRKIEAWRRYYNEARPHTALDWATPAEFARRVGRPPPPARKEEAAN
jgi:putative transposase